MSWSSWLSAKTAEIGDGLRDFTSQLQDDATEVQRETRETVQQANSQLAQNLERAGDELANLRHAANLEALIDTAQLQADHEKVRAGPRPLASIPPHTSRASLSSTRPWPGWGKSSSTSTLRGSRRRLARQRLRRRPPSSASAAP